MTGREEEKMETMTVSTSNEETSVGKEATSSGSVNKAKRALIEAVERVAPFSEIKRLYVDYAIAVAGTKSGAARVIGIDRRSIQRWTSGKR